MRTIQQLLFAQHFPFTPAARKIVEEENLSLAGLPQAVIERAELMARHALASKPYFFELHSTELLLQEVLAFPVAKILVSFANQTMLFRQFSAMVADSAYSFLEREQDKGREAAALASQLGMQFDFPEDKQFFVSMPLQQFLSIQFADPNLKLVNQFVSNGNVFLDLNGFLRFLREKSFSIVLSFLPVPVKGLPKRLQAAATAFKASSKAYEKRFVQVAFNGRASAGDFPPCIGSMYGRLADGQKLPHMANFALAAFLNSIGMPKQQILALFKRAPNFNERVASYQVGRIAKQDYAPPSCEKMRSYGYCPNAGCNVKHPLSFYRRQLRKNKANEAKPKEGK